MLAHTILWTSPFLVVLHCNAFYMLYHWQDSAARDGDDDDNRGDDDNDDDDEDDDDDDDDEEEEADALLFFCFAFELVLSPFLS